MKEGGLGVTTPPVAVAVPVAAGLAEVATPAEEVAA